MPQAARSLEAHLLRVRPLFLRLLDKPARTPTARTAVVPSVPVTIAGQPMILSAEFVTQALKLSDEVRSAAQGGARTGSRAVA